VKCLQDAYNDVLSNFANQMEEDIHTTVLVIRNYDGEDLGTFRKNLAEYGVIKVRSYDGAEGGVETLTLEVNAENYKTLLSLLKDAIIENARGYDAKDDRMGGNPNQMNIQSMYSDIDLDANGIEMEFQASMEELLWFVDQHLANTGKGNFESQDVKIIFDRDVLVNETEAISNCKASVGILSNETIVKMHPWTDDGAKELARIKKEQEEAQATDPYRAAFEANRQQPPGVNGDDDGQAE
jgi:SPP1 family phage portal protein